ncbi:hypothetical protein ED733_003940 [Metarhizium rileyi]|uniref:Vps72/YL1 C-terminal domain-containing protein n=1 Tax=Metarhizium rileyi (strain RCEF 4871) TaxID=1649241 RepID=A0A5C6G8B0_METRR|nr:hypothetical protein ED733_003940 [Metarhizium rileyi]
MDDPPLPIIEDSSMMDAESKASDRETSQLSDPPSDLDSSDRDTPTQPTEWLATTRKRRSTAGNRMKSMLANEEPDSDLELLFAEDDNDQGFSDAGEDGSDKELERQAKEKRAVQRKRRAQEAIPAKFRKKVRIDPTTRDSVPSPAPRPKKKSERASWLPSPADLPTRASSRKTTRISKEQLHQQMAEREARRLKQLAQMEKKAARLEAMKKPPMTQEQRLAEAAVVEKRNSKSLNRWEEAEKQREEERKAKLAALNQRTLKGPVITFWSGKGQWDDVELRLLRPFVTELEEKPKKKREKVDKAAKGKGKDKDNGKIDEKKAFIETDENKAEAATKSQHQSSEIDKADGCLTTAGRPTASDSKKVEIDIDIGSLAEEDESHRQTKTDADAIEKSLPASTEVAPAADAVSTSKEVTAKERNVDPKLAITEDMNLNVPETGDSIGKAAEPLGISATISTAILEKETATSADSDKPQPPASASASASAPSPSTSIFSAQTYVALPSDPPNVLAAPPPPPPPSTTTPATSRPPEARPSSVLAAPVLTSPPEVAMNTSSLVDSSKPNVLALPDTLHPAVPTPLPELSSPSTTATATATATIPIKSDARPAIPADSHTQATQHHEYALTSKSGSPRESEAPPAVEAPRDMNATRNGIIFQNFDENAIRDKNVQTQILFGRKMTKLAKPAPAPICVITNGPARYRDPETNLPFYNMHAYKEIRRLYQGDYRWSRILGAWVGNPKQAARGVPERFLHPGGGKPETAGARQDAEPKQQGQPGQEKETRAETSAADKNVAAKAETA